ncbi:phage/plasmid primase, P4 family [Paraburkholderia sp. CNPSo 3281]|uniref:phage/plasmid primase, P4 family n=1 Tax=Paraburkholderia sp. CNPSo 3281 TaxID=2940933 RepID=UPI0020B86DD0|nr:phage/plasmid primase, P4 family [Paraburkholderia sp. CNPSo 3281]MCP3714889.1 phage/plasmid primase, P4 family [Paraburkholderia sp. CNPSo 3281]
MEHSTPIYSNELQPYVDALAPILIRVRRDVHGVRNTSGNQCKKAPLTDELLRQHVSGGTRRGAYFSTPGSPTVQLALFDLDSHKGEVPWAEMQAAALEVVREAEKLGLCPIPFRSSGGSGIHLLVLWDSPQDARSVRTRMREILSSAGYADGTGGVAAGQVEIFPKQDVCSTFGHMFLLPLGGKSVPLDAFELEDMPREYVLGMAWPVSEPVPIVPAVERSVPALPNVPVKLGRVAEFIEWIPNSDAYELPFESGPGGRDYLSLVIAIHRSCNGSEEGRTLAHQLAARSAKYDPADVDKRYDSVTDREGGITIKTLEAAARHYGWEPPVADDFEVLARAEAAAVGGPENESRATAVSPPTQSSGVTPPRAYRARTEFGNVERMLDRYGAGLMFVPELRAWYIWTGVYWRVAVDVELEALAKETIRALPDEAAEIESAEERIEFFRFCAACQKAAMMSNMIRLAASDPRVVVPVAELDRHSHLLGCANGVVDLQTGKLLPPDKAHRVTVVTPIAYDPGATAPLFEQTVREVFFDEAGQIEFFQRLVGYSLMASPREDLLVIPFGAGSNGKSTVLGAIRSALGAHAKSASAETFLSTNGGNGAGGQAREDLLRLRGARFVYVGEPDEGSELREGLVKSMTGGDPIPARGMYAKSTVEIVPTWVAFMPTNHRPIVKGDDYAIWRRLMLVPFTRNFDTDPDIAKDPGRAERIAAELPGVLAWCVRGALVYRQHGLRPTKQVAAARESYREDMDLLGDWLSECCEQGATYAATNGDLWMSWRHFAERRGELRFISNSSALSRRLQTRGFLRIKDDYGIRGRGLAGIRVVAEADLESCDLL